MALVKRIGYGCYLKVDNVAVGAIVDGWDTDSSADTGETTLLADFFKTFKKGSVDPGTVNFVVAYDNDTDTDNATLTELYYKRASASFTVVLSDEGSGEVSLPSFTGYVVGISEAVKKNELITRTIQVKKSGDPGLTDAVASSEIGAVS